MKCIVIDHVVALPAMRNVHMAIDYLALKVDIIGRVVQCK